MYFVSSWRFCKIAFRIELYAHKLDRLNIILLKRSWIYSSLPTNKLRKVQYVVYQSERRSCIYWFKKKYFFVILNNIFQTLHCYNPTFSPNSFFLTITESIIYHLGLEIVYCDRCGRTVNWTKGRSDVWWHVYPNFFGIAFSFYNKMCFPLHP